jgi:ABC-2 type transport system permease protein
MTEEPRPSPIRDLGYRRYDGPRLDHRRRYRVLAGRTLSLAWTSGLVKTVAIIGMFPSVVCAVVMYTKIRGAQVLQAQGVPVPDALQNPEHWVFYAVYWCQIWFAFAMSLIVAAPAVAEDVRTGAFTFYFSRPLSRAHYIVGKLLAVGLLIFGLCAGPGLLLSLLRIALAGSGTEALSQLPLLLITTLYAALLAATLTLPALALSAVSHRGGLAVGGWAALFFVPWVLAEPAAAATGMAQLTLLSVPTSLRLVGQHLYGIPPSYELPWIWPAATLIALIAVAAWALHRRLDRVEVFT